MADVSTTLDNILAHWELEETTGDRTDSANSYDLTDNNTVGTASGKQGEAGDFTPNDNFSRAVEATWGYNSGGGAANTDLSTSFWFKADSVSGVQGLVGYYQGSGAGAHEWLVYLNGTSLILLVNNQGTAITSSTTISTGTWYHVVATMDSSNNYNLYVNGGSAGTGSGAGGSGTTNINFRLGAYGTTPTGYFNGIIDEVTITTDVITNTEKNTIYNSGDGIPWEAAATTSIKEINGLAHADIKSWNGVIFE